MKILMIILCITSAFSNVLAKDSFHINQYHKMQAKNLMSKVRVGFNRKFSVTYKKGARKLKVTIKKGTKGKILKVTRLDGTSLYTLHVSFNRECNDPDWLKYEQCAYKFQYLSGRKGRFYLINVPQKKGFRITKFSTRLMKRKIYLMIENLEILGRDPSPSSEEQTEEGFD